MTLPARAGEALRSVYVGSELKMSTSFAFATCLVERVIDLIILILLDPWQSYRLEIVPRYFLMQ